MIERYSHEKHYELVSGWMKERNITPPPKELFYDEGYLLDGIVVAFLVHTNSKIGQIDNLVADPHAPVKQRRDAVRRIILYLSAVAKGYGMRMIQAFTIVPTIKELTPEMGFQVYGEGYTVYFKDLGGATCPG